MKKSSKKRDWLVTARENKKLTQQKLGKLVGVSDNAITQYEKGIRMPKPKILVKLCEVLDISVELFYN